MFRRLFGNLLLLDRLLCNDGGIEWAPMEGHTKEQCFKHYTETATVINFFIVEEVYVTILCLSYFF